MRSQDQCQAAQLVDSYAQDPGVYSDSKGTLGCAQHNNWCRLIAWRIKHLFGQPCLV